MRLLVIEPDTLTRTSLELMLRAEGCCVDAAEDGESGFDLATHYGFDAIVMSMELPDASGLSALRRLRARLKTPLLALSRDIGVEPEILALAAGADDFLRKPFHKEVLTGRLNALVRRTGGHADPVITVGRLSINTLAKTAQVDAARVSFTVTEFRILECMALRIGHTFTKHALMDHLYGGLNEPEEKIIDVFICKIRNKLRAHDCAQHVETVWGRGYRVVAEPSQHVWTPPSQAAPTGYQAEILDSLSKGPATFPQVWALFPVAPESSIRAALHTLIQRGDVINTGEPRAALYRLRRQAAAA